MIVISVLVGVIAVTLLVPTISDLLSLGSLIRARHRVHREAASPVPQRLLFLVPAHDEALLIKQCVHSLMRLHYDASWFDIVVIADNCTDSTATLARSAGAQCLERHEPTLAGKPRAIAWALERLPVGSYDALVIVDADTVVDPEFAAALASAGPLREKAVQGYNGVSNPNESAITRMAAVLADAKCRFAYGLKAHAGLNVPLRLGGCLGTSVLARHGWQAFSIGEDWELYAQLTSWGVRIENSRSARVYAQEARSMKQSGPQRQRWTAGKLFVLARTLGPVLRSACIGLHQKLDVIAELSAPGPVVHLGIVLVLAGIALSLRLPFEVALVTLLGAGVARHVLFTIAALITQPDPLKSALAFGFLPVYGLWRIPTEFLALRMIGEKPWIRTERHAD